MAGRPHFGPCPRLRFSLRLVPRTPSTAASALAGRGPRATSRRPPRGRGNADCPADRLDPLAALLVRPLPRPLRTGAGCPAVLGYTFFRPERPSWPHPADPSFMLQCCNISATKGLKRPRSQTKHKNWCVTHLLGYLQSPNCLPGVFLTEAVRCLSLFFPSKKMD